MTEIALSGTAPSSGQTDWGRTSVRAVMALGVLCGVFKILQMEIKLSSIYHPQIDGQTKHVNQVLKQYL